jgi:hypothetical protein
MTRSEQLKEWERSRRSERTMDAMAYWWRAIIGVAIAASAWKGVDSFGLASPDVWRFAIALLTVAYIVGRLILWLRTEGSYLERRLAEVEALIANETPQYYTSGGLVDYERNPLYEPFTAIEASIEALRRGTF